MVFDGNDAWQPETGQRSFDFSVAELEAEVASLARDTGEGVFGIRQNRRLQVFFDFARFSAALAERMDGSTALVRVDGGGRVDGINELTMRRILITLE